jgi:cardiolipin synthase
MNFSDILIGRQVGLTFPWFAFAHTVLVFLFAIRLIWFRRPVSVSFAWFLVVVMLPAVGIVLYVMFGERPVGRTLTKKSCGWSASTPSSAAQCANTTLPIANYYQWKPMH